MDFSVSKEAFVFVSCVLCGGVLFFIYDLFRVIRQKAGSGRALTHIQDGVFWVVAFVIMFYLIFTVNRGTMRFYEILGAALGALLYGITLSPWVLKILNNLIDFFSKIFKVFLKILLTPLFFAYNILYRYICLLFRPFLKIGRFLLRRLTENVKRTGRMIKKK